MTGLEAANLNIEMLRKAIEALRGGNECWCRPSPARPEMLGLHEAACQLTVLVMDKCRKVEDAGPIERPE